MSERPVIRYKKVSAKRLASLTHLHTWERPGYLAVEKPLSVIKAERKKRSEQDKSPAYIKRLRAALCDEFIKTGNLNNEIQSKLRDYANACKTSAVAHAPDPANRDERIS